MGRAAASPTGQLAGERRASPDATMRPDSDSDLLAGRAAPLRQRRYFGDRVFDPVAHVERVRREREARAEFKPALSSGPSATPLYTASPTTVSISPAALSRRNIVRLVCFFWRRIDRVGRGTLGAGHRPHRPDPLLLTVAVAVGGRDE